jgi:hypothetical protein
MILVKKNQGLLIYNKIANCRSKFILNKGVDGFG